MAKSSRSGSKKSSSLKKVTKKSAKKSTAGKKASGVKIAVAKKVAAKKSTSKKLLSKKPSSATKVSKKVAAKKPVTKKKTVKSPAIKVKKITTKTKSKAVVPAPVLNEETARANDYNEMIKGNSEMPDQKITNNDERTDEVITMPRSIPVPEERYARPADPYHGHTAPVKGKRNIAPSGKKPLWNK